MLVHGRRKDTPDRWSKVLASRPSQCRTLRAACTLRHTGSCKCTVARRSRHVVLLTLADDQSGFADATESGMSDNNHESIPFAYSLGLLLDENIFTQHACGSMAQEAVNICN